jgi:hypothetical protein
MSEHFWYADSGATYHMCNDESYMHNYTPTSVTWNVTGIGGVQLNVRGEEDDNVLTMINGVQYTAVLQNVLTKKKGLSLPKR